MGHIGRRPVKAYMEIFRVLKSWESVDVESSSIPHDIVTHT